MPVLLLDTATERGFVAIIHEGEVLHHAKLPFGIQNAQFVLPAIEQGLKATGLAVKDLQFVGVGVGPGSYTGIRVGATVAKTLAFTCRLPLVGVCSLDAFAPADDGLFAAVVDAKIGGLYVQTGRYAAGVVLELSGPLVLPMAEAAHMLAHIPLLVTPNAGQIRQKLEGVNPAVSWKWQEMDPVPLVMATRGKAKFEGQEFSLDGHLDLLYMRKTQAEMERG